jgi:hypothetical protein
MYRGITLFILTLGCQRLAALLMPDIELAALAKGHS